MAVNLKRAFNDPQNNNNPLIKFYLKKYDTNNDGKLSDEEIDAIEEKDPELNASIFKAINTLEYQNSSENGESFNNDVTSNEEDTENLFVNTKDIEGLNFDSFKQLSSNENNDEITSKFWQFLSKFDMNKLFDYINTDKDDVISQEELMNLSSIDGMNENLSLADLKEFLDNTEEIQSEEQSIPDESAEEEKAPEVRKGKNRFTGGGSDYTPNVSSNVANNTVDTKTEYTNNLNNAKTAFNTAKSNYENVLDGNINDPDVQAKKDAMDNAYDAWQEELKQEDPTLSQNIDTAKQDVETINQEISQNEKEIFENETNLSDCETAYDSAVSYREGLESKRSELQSALSGLDSSNETDAKRIESYQNQINSINSEIEAAKAKEEEAKQAKEDAQKALDNSKDQKTELETQLKEKEEILAEYVAKAEELGKNNPTLMSLQQDYENKKQTYETALKEYKEALKAEAISKHEDVIQSQKTLSDYENNEKIESYNAIFGEYDEEFADLFNKYLLEGASDHSKSDCGGAVRRAMYKATLEKYGPEVAAIFKEGYGVVGADWDNQYLADCPLFTDITDSYSTSEIEQMIKNGELKGAIINYEVYRKDSISGHVEGVTTRGLTSDYTRSYDLYSSGSALGQAKRHIFVPRVATKEEIDQYIQLMISRMKSYHSPII